MVALISRRPPAAGRTWALHIALISLVTWLVCPNQCRAGEPLFPVPLMNWMTEGVYHALIADKSRQQLSVWQIKDGEPTLVETFRCSTGENNGDKWVRGDMRTPEGVYFFCSVIDGKTLPPKYGPWAFTTDYPNFVDRRRGKNGDGIWLHGRDKPLAVKPDSNGCVALENRDLVKVSRYVRLQSTPLVVVDKVRMAPRSVIVEQEREVRNFIEQWRRSWESKDLEAYMAHYSPNFQSCNLDFRGWKEKKKRLNKRYGSIKVKLGHVHLYRQDGIINAVFSQSYHAEGFESYGIKQLYIMDEGKYSIYAEDYHQPVDDQFPVGALLARVGVEPAPVIVENVERKDLRIKLVSTDENDQQISSDNETPQPIAPSRGATLERLAAAPAKDFSRLAEQNEKLIPGSSPLRLIVTLQTDTAPAEPEAAQTEVLEIARDEQLRRTACVAPDPTPVESAQPSAPVRLAVEVKEKDSEKKQPENQFNKAASEGSAADNKPNQRKIIVDFLQQWKKAWEQKDLDRFMKMYHPEYEQGAMNLKALKKSKQNFFRKYQSIRVELDRLEIRKMDDGAHVSFVQIFHGDGYRDKGRKTMVLAIGKDKGIHIVSEEWSPIAGGAADSGS